MKQFLSLRKRSKVIINYFREMYADKLLLTYAEATFNNAKAIVFLEELD